MSAPMERVFDVDDVIQCAAELVDGATEVDDEYRRGVVELAARICLWSDAGCRFEHAVTVMGYAVCGVNRHTLPAVPASTEGPTHG